MWTWPWRRRHRRVTPAGSAPPPEPAAWRDWQEWRPTSPRARGLIVAVAVATAVGVLLAMLQPQLRLLRARADAPAAPAPADCVARPGEGCAGGKLDVLVLPPAAGASR